MCDCALGSIAHGVLTPHPERRGLRRYRRSQLRLLARWRASPAPPARPVSEPGGRGPGARGALVFYSRRAPRSVELGRQPRFGAMPKRTLDLFAQDARRGQRRQLVQREEPICVVSWLGRGAPPVSSHRKNSLYTWSSMGGCGCRLRSQTAISLSALQS